MVGRMPAASEMPGLGADWPHDEDIVLAERAGDPLLHLPAPDVQERGSAIIRRAVGAYPMSIGISNPDIRIGTVTLAMASQVLAASDRLCLVSRGVVDRELARGMAIAFPIDAPYLSGAVGTTRRDEGRPGPDRAELPAVRHDLARERGARPAGPPVQGGEDADHPEHRPGDVDHRRPRPQRPTRRPGHAGQGPPSSAPPRRGPFGPHLAREEALARMADHLRVRGCDRRRAQAEPVHRAGADVLQHHVRARRQVARDREPLLRLRIERHRALVAVEHREIARAGSPPMGSTSITSAPRSPRIIAAVGAITMWETSTTRMSSRPSMASSRAGGIMGGMALPPPGRGAPR